MAFLLSAWCDSRRASCRTRSASPSSPFMTLSCREREGRAEGPLTRPAPRWGNAAALRGTAPHLGSLQQQDNGVLPVLLGLPGEEGEGCGTRVTAARAARPRPRPAAPGPPHLPGSPRHPQPAGPAAAARTPSRRRPPPRRGPHRAMRAGTAGAPRGSAVRPDGTGPAAPLPPAYSRAGPLRARPRHVMRAGASPGVKGACCYGDAPSWLRGPR